MYVSMTTVVRFDYFGGGVVVPPEFFLLFLPALCWVFLSVLFVFFVVGCFGVFVVFDAPANAAENSNINAMASAFFIGTS